MVNLFYYIYTTCHNFIHWLMTLVVTKLAITKLAVTQNEPAEILSDAERRRIAEIRIARMENTIRKKQKSISNLKKYDSDSTMDHLDIVRDWLL